MTTEIVCTTMQQETTTDHMKTIEHILQAIRSVAVSAPETDRKAIIRVLGGVPLALWQAQPAAQAAVMAPPTKRRSPLRRSRLSKAEKDAHFAALVAERKQRLGW
jgi:hypothetical protein